MFLYTEVVLKIKNKTQVRHASFVSLQRIIEFCYFIFPFCSAAMVTGQSLSKALRYSHRYRYDYIFIEYCPMNINGQAKLR